MSVCRSIISSFHDVFSVIHCAAQLGVTAYVSEGVDRNWHATFSVNFHSAALLMQNLWEGVKRSDSARLVFVTSGAARGTASWPAYSSSKAALNAFVIGLSQVCDATGVQACLVSPGPLRTELRKQAAPTEDPLSVPSPEVAAKIICDLLLTSVHLNGKIIVLGRGCHDLSTLEPAPLKDFKI